MAPRLKPCCLILSNNSLVLSNSKKVTFDRWIKNILRDIVTILGILTNERGKEYLLLNNLYIKSFSWPFYKEFNLIWKTKLVTKDFIWRQMFVNTSWWRRFLCICNRRELNKLKMPLLDFRFYLVLGLVPWKQVFWVWQSKNLLAVLVAVLGCLFLHLIFLLLVLLERTSHVSWSYEVIARWNRFRIIDTFLVIV